MEGIKEAKEAEKGVKFPAKKADILEKAGNMNMQVHSLAPGRGRATFVRRQLESPINQIHGMFFDLLFPSATPHQKQRGADRAAVNLFTRGTRGSRIILRPSLAFLDTGQKVLITDEERYADLPDRRKRQFTPVLVLESRSHRARFWISPGGELIEFKGLTPFEFDETAVNVNSGQPEGLFAAGPAELELEGLEVAGGIEAQGMALETLFPDLDGYAQIFRMAKPGEKYFPIQRMDVGIPMYTLLAELEGVPLEKFLCDAAERFGGQLRKIHEAKRTLQDPFGGGVADREPFFSSLHSGNVDTYGNIIDLEGLAFFQEAEEAFWGHVPQGSTGWEIIPSRVRGELRNRPFDIFCRAGDLQRFIGGRNRREASLYKKIFVDGKDQQMFLKMLTRILSGYYGEKERTGRAGGNVRDIRSFVSDRDVMVTLRACSFEEILNLMITVEGYLGIEGHFSGGAAPDLLGRDGAS